MAGLLIISMAGMATSLTPPEECADAQCFGLECDMVSPATSLPHPPLFALALFLSANEDALNGGTGRSLLQLYSTGTETISM